jgi:SAM-dependent methyltransferase
VKRNKRLADLASTLLAHPLLAGHGLDESVTTALRRQVITENKFLGKLYADWYQVITASLPDVSGPALELGSGPGHIERYLYKAIRSDLLEAGGVDVNLDAHDLPFATGSLSTIVMTNVLHHLHSPTKFLAEADRAIQPGGRIIMIEPWVTTWSTLVYTHLHHEYFGPDASDWHTAPGGPLSSANGALPWIIFERDQQRFKRDFPQWEVSVRPWMPFRYLVSGGVSMRPLMPSWSYGAWVRLEAALQPWMRHWAMFATIVLTRRDNRRLSSPAEPLPAQGG